MKGKAKSLRGLIFILPGYLTAQGTATRERIEAETDRYFFAPWPDAVGAQTEWATERLAAVNAALA